MAMPSDVAGMEALNCLKSTDPLQWLALSSSLSQTARMACEHLFSSINPHVSKSPFDQLLIDGFDAEQIWQQIDLQSQPLLSSLHPQVLYFEKNPLQIRVFDDRVLQEKMKVVEEKEAKKINEIDNVDDDMDMYEVDDEDDSADDHDDDEEEEGEEEEGEEGEEEERSQEEESGEEEGEKGVIEDKFLKIKELEDFLEEEDAKEYGLDRKKNNKNKNLNEEDEDDSEEDNEEDEEDEDDEVLGIFGDGDEEDEEENKNARYEDFFGGTKKAFSRKKSKLASGFDEYSISNDEAVEKIEEMEKANLEPKTWTMQGEVTAASRPKNSALEVDLDFEHTMRPAPVITQEVTEALEDIIKNRIIEERFDDIQKARSLSSKPPGEVRELDENKSKKGLGDVYEEEYVRKTNLAAAPLSFSDEQKREASVLFKELCLKLDALSHFHFAPKPVIEETCLSSQISLLLLWRRLHLWQFQMQLCWLLRKVFLEKVT